MARTALKINLKTTKVCNKGKKSMADSDRDSKRNEIQVTQPRVKRETSMEDGPLIVKLKVGSRLNEIVNSSGVNTQQDEKPDLATMEPSTQSNPPAEPDNMDVNGQGRAIDQTANEGKDIKIEASANMETNPSPPTAATDVADHVHSENVGAPQVDTGMTDVQSQPNMPPAAEIGTTTTDTPFPTTAEAVPTPILQEPAPDQSMFDNDQNFDLGMPDAPPIVEQDLPIEHNFKSNENDISEGDLARNVVDDILQHALPEDYPTFKNAQEIVQTAEDELQRQGMGLYAQPNIIPNMQSPPTQQYPLGQYVGDQRFTPYNSQAPQLNPARQQPHPITGPQQYPANGQQPYHTPGRQQYSTTGQGPYHTPGQQHYPTPGQHFAPHGQYYPMDPQLSGPFNHGFQTPAQPNTFSPLPQSDPFGTTENSDFGGHDTQRQNARYPPGRMPMQMIGQSMGQQQYSQMQRNMAMQQNTVVNNGGMLNNNMSARDLYRANVLQKQKAWMEAKEQRAKSARPSRAQSQVGSIPPSPNMAHANMEGVGPHGMSHHDSSSYYTAPSIGTIHGAENPQQYFSNSSYQGNNGYGLPAVPMLPSNAFSTWAPADNTHTAHRDRTSSIQKKHPLPANGSDDQDEVPLMQRANPTGKATVKGGNKKAAAKRKVTREVDPAEYADGEETESYRETESDEAFTSPGSGSTGNSSACSKSDPVDLSSPAAGPVQLYRSTDVQTAPEDQGQDQGQDATGGASTPLVDIGSWKLPAFEITREPTDKKDDLTIIKVSIPGIVREEIILNPEYSDQEMHLFVNIFMPAQQALAEPDPEPAHAILNFHTISNMVIDAFVQYEIGDTFGLSNNNPAYGARKDDEEFERKYDAQDADIDDIYFAVVDRWRAGLESKKQPAQMIRGCQEFSDVALEVIHYIKENGLLEQPKGRKQRKDKGVSRQKAAESSTTPASKGKSPASKDSTPASKGKGKGKTKAKEEKIPEKTPAKRAAADKVNTLQPRKKAKTTEKTTPTKAAKANEGPSYSVKVVRTYDAE